MEFIKANFLNTTTQITVNSNTATAASLYNKDLVYQYYTDGLNNDLTTSAITITFDATTPVSRIAMLGINYKEFSFFYNGATANSISLTNADTTTSSYTGNTDANKYFRFTTIQCTSITINAKKTMTADQEKIIGMLLISDFNFELPNPSAKQFKPKIIPKQIVHKLSDGGTRIHNVRQKWETQFSLEHVTEANRDTLYDIYISGIPFVFSPFGTATSWDAQIFECVWDGPFDFYQFSENASASGFSGKISLKETAI